MHEPAYKIVQLQQTHSIHDFVYRETYHPVIGPVAEAETLYVQQLNLCERLRQHVGEFVVWDVGLGAAANTLTLLRMTRDVGSHLRVISFDQTTEPLRFARENAEQLGYFSGYEAQVSQFLESGRTTFSEGNRKVDWELQLGNFPTLVEAGDPKFVGLPKPHAIFVRCFFSCEDPEMWTLELFSDLYRALDPQRPCVLATYSRSTMLRVTLLLAGFFVGVGHATGEKEETTVASNKLSFLSQPLDRKKLFARIQKSDAAEPLRNAVYRQSPITQGNWTKLQRHPQFR